MHLSYSREARAEYSWFHQRDSPEPCRLLQGLNKLVHIKHFVYIDDPQERLLETAHSQKVVRQEWVKGKRGGKLK